jgi:tellurite resistance protein TerC
VLVLVGAKMLLTDVYKLPVLASLGAIAGILGASVLASLVWPPRGVAPSSSAGPPR